MVSKIIMDKVLALEKLKQEMLDNKKLPLKTNLVFGEGSSDCQVLFIGEAPGAVEDQQVTRQIEILHPKIIVTLGRFSMNYFLGREENKIKEILFSERATKICYAYFLPEAKITRDQGHLFLAGNLFVAPVFHPAAALRAPAMMEAFKKSFKNLPKILKKVDEMK